MKLRAFIVRETRFRAVLFAVSFIAMLWGYQQMLFVHLPGVFTDTLEDMSYGWFVPLFSLYVLWRERSELLAAVAADARRKGGPGSVWGVFVLLPSLFAGFLGIRGLQIRLEIVGFVGALFGLAWTLFGFRTVRRVLFPFGFLLFCLPLHSYLDLVTIHLRMLAVSIASGVLQGCGAGVVRQGTMLMSSSGSFAIDVAEPCSGMRSLFAMMALTAGYAYFNQPTWPRRWLLFALSVPIAVVGNVSRILSIVAIAATCSPGFATGFYHDYSGYVIFLVSVLLMVATGELISKGAERCVRG